MFGLLLVLGAAQECTRTMGHVLDVDARGIDEQGSQLIVDAVKQHGVVVLRDQHLTRSEQVELSSKLGEVVVLPPSFEGLDPEPGHPAIQRVTNYWANGTWKGVRHSFGAYWHQDGQFWPRTHRWILSMLACAEAPPRGGETGFADLQSSLATLDPNVRERAARASIAASVRDIADFVHNGLKEELDLFDDVEHPIIDTFPDDDTQPLLYVGSPHMRITADDATLIPLILDHATASNVYYHQWQPGDVVIWDNVQTLHKAHPYNNTPDVRRELYRTQFRLTPSQTHLDRHPTTSRPRWLRDDGSVKWLDSKGNLQPVV